METRTARLIVNKSGSGSSTFRATLPTSWIRSLGLSEDTRNIILALEDDKITIQKEMEEMIRIPSIEGEWNIIIGGIEYNFYYPDNNVMQGLFLNGYDSQDEGYKIGNKIITATKEEYPHNKQGHRYILEIR